MKERTKLGRNIESVMLAAHFTQEALGQEIGVSQSTMSRLLTSNVERDKDFHYVEKIANATNAPIHLLVAGTEFATKVPAPCVVTLDPESRIKWLVYFASALTGLDDAQRKRIDTDAAMARQACEEIQGLLYEPAWYTDPKANRELSPSQVYSIDHQQVSQSHIMIFNCRYPSFGAGQELEIAAAAGLPVILLEPRDARVSRMVRGTYVRLSNTFHPKFADTRVA
jgi:transcriptional regulator with XRE-family HTH domain